LSAVENDAENNWESGQNSEVKKVCFHKENMILQSLNGNCWKDSLRNQQDELLLSLISW